MKRLLTLLAVAASCGFIFALIGAQAAKAASPCFGVGVDPGYLQAFDALSGPVGAINYPQGRFYREVQTWATPRGADPGHHSEHIHVAACIPNGQTMAGPFRLDLAYTFHNMDDYAITSASMSAYSAAGSNALWVATPAQLAQLQAASDTSGNGSVQRVYFSVTTTPAGVNGWKEIRGAITTLANGPNAVFHDWRLDPRWYYVDNYATLPPVSPAPFQPSQNAIRSRPVITFVKADGTISNTTYHHSGWCGMNGQYMYQGATVFTDCYSARWKSSLIDDPWSRTADKRVGLYVTDGGGNAFLMIDPDFHHHYDAPTASCPNIDAAGNCLGVWYWSGVLCCSAQTPERIIPASVMASLSPGLHKLVFRSDDPPECERANPPNCNGTERGEWSNVEVLPFKVV